MRVSACECASVRPYVRAHGCTCTFVGFLFLCVRVYRYACVYVCNLVNVMTQLSQLAIQL